MNRMPTPEQAFVDDWMAARGVAQLSYDDVGSEALIFDWIKAQAPDAWHKYAISFNWDEGTEIARWIVDQPRCDRGTALYLYYAAQPDYYARYASLEEAHAVFADEEVVDLMTAICANWARGLYASYRYSPGWVAEQRLPADVEQRLALAAAVPWDVPDDMARAGVEGEEIAWGRTRDGCLNGLSPAFDDAVNARFEPWSDDEQRNKRETPG
jgi:hypothetical protein